MEPGPEGKWNSRAAGVFEEILSQVVTVTVHGKTTEKYLVSLKDESGVDVAARIAPTGMSRQ